MKEETVSAKTSPESGLQTILTIDDDQTVRNSFALMLEDLGYRVLEASNGLAGIDIVEQQCPDLALLDLRMPGLSGHETLLRLRQIAPELPVIVVSGTGKVSDVVDALHAGAWDFLLKPVEDLTVLQHCIEKALERAWLRQQNRDYQKALEEKVAYRTQALQETNAQLARSEEKYRSIFESLQDAYFETCLNGTLLEISPAIERILQTPAANLLNTNLANCFQDSAAWPAMLAALHTDGQLVDYEIILVAADGLQVSCSLNASLRYDTDTAPEKITGSIRDISQRKVDENRLRHINQTLEALFDAAPLAIMAVDTGFLVTLWNRAAERMFGWSREEIIGQTYPLAPPGKEAEAQVNLSRALAGDQYRGLEVVRQCKNGQQLEVSASTAPLCDENGDIRGLILIVEDISERRRLRNEADRASRLASLGELAAGVAHEINNPNGLVLLNLPTLREFIDDALALLQEYATDHSYMKLGGLSPQRAAEAFPQLLNEIEDGSKRIKQIVEDLKDFARQDSGIPAEQFDLNDSVKKALRLAGNHIKKATNHCQLQLQPDLPPLVGSPQRLEQVIVNLLVNACEALSDRDQAITVLTIHDQANQQLQICINDEGCGIDAQNLPHVTDPFFTTRRESGGTGLGLSVSARIIKEHGGKLDFNSEPHRGTSACISLPLPTRT